MSVRGWLLDLDRSVRNLLGQANGGTGNAQGYGTAVVQAFSNGFGATIPLGTVVSLLASYDDSRVTPSPTADGTDVIGVVVGSYVGDDGVTFQAVAPGASKLAAVMTSGTCTVVIGSAVTRGQYAYVDATDGSAKSSATLSAGAFGIFETSAASGTATVVLGVHAGAGGGGGLTGGTPALTLSTTNSAGVASTAVLTDATVAVFDATTPAAVGTAATGSAGKAARRDHVHATGAGTPSTQAFGDSPSTGTGPAAAMTDHKHGMPAAPTGAVAGTPGLTYGTSNATGAAATFVATDASVAVFDATNPAATVPGNAAVVGTAAFAARRDHVHPRLSDTFAITVVLDNGGVALLASTKADVYCPFAFTIQEVTLLADTSGSIVIDIWSRAYSSYPPTVSQTITASALPTISSALKSQDSTLTGWTTAVPAGNSLRFNVNSVTSITRCVLTLKCVRT